VEFRSGSVRREEYPTAIWFEVGGGPRVEPPAVFVDAGRDCGSYQRRARSRSDGPFRISEVSNRSRTEGGPIVTGTGRGTERYKVAPSGSVASRHCDRENAAARKKAGPMPGNRCIHAEGRRPYSRGFSMNRSSGEQISWTCAASRNFRPPKFHERDVATGEFDLTAVRLLRKDVRNSTAWFASGGLLPRGFSRNAVDDVMSLGLPPSRTATRRRVLARMTSAPSTGFFGETLPGEGSMGRRFLRRKRIGLRRTIICGSRVTILRLSD